VDKDWGKVFTFQHDSARPTWVTDWQYCQARQRLLKRADLLVWLDQPGRCGVASDISLCDKQMLKQANRGRSTFHSGPRIRQSVKLVRDWSTATERLVKVGDRKSRLICGDTLSPAGLQALWTRGRGPRSHLSHGQQVPNSERGKG
jgi:hypothetical protein